MKSVVDSKQPSRGIVGGRLSFTSGIARLDATGGRIAEVRDHLITASDEGFLSKEKLGQLDAKAISVIKLLNGYIRATTLRKNSKGLAH